MDVLLVVSLCPMSAVVCVCCRYVSITCCMYAFLLVAFYACVEHLSGLMHTACGLTIILLLRHSVVTFGASHEHTRGLKDLSCPKHNACIRCADPGRKNCDISVADAILSSRDTICKGLTQGCWCLQNALARFQYARTLARNTGLRPWQRLVQLAHCNSRRAEQWANKVATRTAFR